MYSCTEFVQNFMKSAPQVMCCYHDLIDLDLFTTLILLLKIVRC